MTATTTGTPAARYAAGASGILPVFTYERRSRVGKGAALTMDAQHAENVTYAAGVAPGADVVDFRDNASGWDENKTRDDWEAMLEAIAAGKASAVIAWHSDRFSRQPAQLEQLISACRKGGAELHTRLGGHHSDPTMIRIEMALAAKESDTKSERLKLKHGTKAAGGEFHGGRRRFGYNRDMTALDAAEADAIRDAAARVLSGESLRSITARWNAAGLTTPTGKQWRSPNVGKLLRGPHLAGIRVHGDDRTAATWPAIFDADTHESLRRFLGDPDRVVSGFAGVRKYALSGLLRCAVCDSPMYGRATRLKSGPAYCCRNGQHTQAPTARVDETVRAFVVERLAAVDASGVFVAPVDADRANARAAERLALADNRRATVADVLLAPADRAGALAAIDARIAELDAEAAAEDDAGRLPLRVLEGLTGVPADVVGERFDALPFDRQRAVIAVLGVPVLARASRKGFGLPFEPERVTMRWADGPA